MVQIRQKIEYDCDVLIVGGGPAGSALAYHLAKANIKTIVIEAKKFPRDKVCGDGVSPVALRELHAMGITKTDTFKKANSIDTVGLFMKNDQAHINLEKPDDLPFHARIIPRMELDAMIYDTAKKEGAVFYENCRMIDYKVYANKVVTTYKNGKKEGRLISKLIVGADGSRSLVGRKLRGYQPDPAYQLLGLRSYYEGVNGPRNRVDVYFSEENFPGIYWLFPKGETGANVGMAMIFKTCPKEASEVRQCFANHIATNPDLRKRLGNGKATEKIQGWPITFYDSRNPITADRAMLVGEAAGLINPLSGDGIQYAVLSARWAAESLIDCIQQDDCSVDALAGYKKQLEKELAYDFSLSNLLVQFGRNKTLTPLWMTFLNILISRCKNDPKFAAIIAGIFEGTYPSYKALTPDFIMKILLQAGMDANDYLLNGLTQPGQIVTDGAKLAVTTRNTVTELAKNPKAHLSWLADVAGKTLHVAKHTLHTKIDK
ncbi:geranylgeranyl reductase family protein [uncultured Marixanthomonas sp.]|uniref:geranylgeranyl reductase family protein n=1 Tax=uncultured Marixanthomonas sp. TaxID=757245 RepID=UPI0030D6CE06|tara:strand:+ start:24324 stop:25787 length:1464 start_codon:yes stop_codon:yes gene_type:complete